VVAPFAAPDRRHRFLVAAWVATIDGQWYQYYEEQWWPLAPWEVAYWQLPAWYSIDDRTTVRVQRWWNEA
jgi:hypothetical protein